MEKAKRIKVICALTMIISGILIFAYPFIGQYLSAKNATVAVESYINDVAQMQEETVDAVKAAAQARNELLSDVDRINGADADQANETYLDIVSIGTAIGYITIPGIDLKLPICEGTSDAILEKSIGHIPETSYPIGGESTHSVLTGHRGLASAELFMNLDKVEAGHRFYLHILDEVLAYEVDQIKTVEPENIADLTIIEGEDLCTLVTCTPLGINSHRLLVRGHRVAYNGEEDDTEGLYQMVHTGTAMQRLVEVWPWLTLAAILVMGFELFLCMTILKNMRQRKEED